MIKINMYKNGFDINGHANYDEVGKDIVCAGVSAIGLGCSEYFKSQTDQYSNEVVDGHQKFYLKSNFQYYVRYMEALKMVGTQLKLIAINYPKYVSFVKVDKVIGGEN